MKYKTLASIVLSIMTLVVMYLLFVPGEEKLVDHANSNIDNMPCQVFFFKRWGTYSHPVTPIDAIEFEEALTREGFCMAWMCSRNGKELFSKFQARNNKFVPTDLLKPSSQAKGLNFYEVLEENGVMAVGRTLRIDEVVNLTSYLVDFPGSENNLILNNQTISYTYRYIYGEDGSLNQAVITNKLGEENIINY